MFEHALKAAGIVAYTILCVPFPSRLLPGRSPSGWKTLFLAPSVIEPRCATSQRCREPNTWGRKQQITARHTIVGLHTRPLIPMFEGNCAIDSDQQSLSLDVYPTFPICPGYPGILGGS